jgi:hypothetical protein
MKVKFKKGTCGYWKGRPFRYPAGAEVDIDADLALSEHRAGHCEYVDFVPAEPVIIEPVVPEIVEVQTTVIKRRRRRNVQADNSTDKRTRK